MKRLAILGSTGSIGESTAEVLRQFPERFRVVALAGGQQVQRLAQQIREHRPELVAVRDAAVAAELQREIGGACRITHGIDGLIEVATRPDVDLVISALVGALGLRPTYAAIDRGIDVALANKECLVAAGRPMTERAAATGARILPVDSEHNAVHQCLRGEQAHEVRRLWLTASGGPFREWDAARLDSVTPEQALCHPTWKMGPKITIDSATLMNKGLEVIEARWLFGLEATRVRVVVHPQSVIHSLVEFVDGSFKAQLGPTRMRHPIQYALSWPERWDSGPQEFDPAAMGPLEFEEPDAQRFGCLALAYRAMELGHAAPAALNAANEIAVEGFLERRLAFRAIPELIAEVMRRHAAEAADSLEQVLEIDLRARRTARRLLEQGVRP